jgi:hypothetical protein
MTSAEARGRLVEALELDLIGPKPGSPYEAEVLPQAPSRWYLTGFLVPYEAKAEDRQDESGQEQLELGDGSGGTDDDDTPEPASARKAFFPSSIGVSVLVPKEAESLDVEVTWGDYAAREQKEDGQDPPRVRWERTPRHARLTVLVSKAAGKPSSKEVPGSDGLRVVTSVRPVNVAGLRGIKDRVPDGTRAVSVFLVNHREPRKDEQRNESMVFQVALVLRLDRPFVPRPNLRGLVTDEWDEQVADLQYADAYEYAVGHGVATASQVTADGTCSEVRTAWVPCAEVEKVEAAAVVGVELGMEALASATDAAAARTMVGPLTAAYKAWIAAQEAKARTLQGDRATVARELLRDAGRACDRIQAGIAALEKEDVFHAWRVANAAMAQSARQRQAVADRRTPAEVPAPRWRPFQLAFLLMNLRGIADPHHGDREIVDLLFFPTGGGKTEAYLGLAAFALVLRRLRNPGVTSAGLSVLMRYTLRLLTLDQLARAATLVCALEKERQKDEVRLGPWPFEIGLWVGRSATPNRMGRKNDGDRDSARARTIAFWNDDRKPSPIPLENCPWCGTKFTRDSFQLLPTQDQPADLRVACVNRRCEFRGDRPLPILAVDDPIYRRLPCFLIATVDKFAGLPWEGRVGMLFGKAERYDASGFYGPCDPGEGRPLPAPLLPPDLIIQDELHLISGPLGTIAGLYETAIDALCTRTEGERAIRPKIVASTATVRRAQTQISALFARSRVDVFPPPGPDRRDSFFARAVPASEKHGRLYAGVGAQGRSPKAVLLRTYLSLLSAAQTLYDQHGGSKNAGNPVDPYMTLVGYFNSLRELGGSRRIVEDEITARVAGYSRRLRVGEEKGLFSDRRLAWGELVELTSRESTSSVADAKRRLALSFADAGRVDVALATNMISVGLDITRLGLMVVFGQPKTTAEYIQATSRVGRDDARPGLVVTLFNVHKPRDRSHYERFEAYHASFYRAVEATSVTPFAPRAVDRGIAAVTVGLARHAYAPLTAPLRAAAITTERPKLGFALDVVGQRAEAHDRRLSKTEAEALRQKMRGRVEDLLDSWTKIAKQKQDVGSGLQYQREEGGAPRLLRDPLDAELPLLTTDERKFRAHRSMRDVEPSTPIWVRRLDGADVPAEGDE